jgi:hypothetical protein
MNLSHRSTNSAVNVLQPGGTPLKHAHRRVEARNLIERIFGISGGKSKKERINAYE